MRRVLVVLVAVVLLASACGSGTGRSRARREAVGAMDRMGQRSRTFTYREVVLDSNTEIEVTGAIQDDLRSRARLSVNGRDVLEQVVSDDALAVRVLDPVAGGPFLREVLEDDAEAAAALTQGRWVIDHQGAPELIAPRTSDNNVLIGANPLLDSLYVFQYLRDAQNRAGGIEEFNPDAPDYNPLDDPWRADAEADLVGEGIRRYDVLLPPLPRPTERGSRTALPGTPHFRKIAFYLRGRTLVEIKEQVKIDDRPEFRRAEAGRSAEYFLELRANALKGLTRDPIRERTMEFEVEPADDVDISLPTDFVSVQPLALLDHVSALVPPLPQSRLSRGGADAPDVSPGASPAASPGASPAGSPAASPTGSPGTSPGASPAAPAVSPTSAPEVTVAP